MLYGIIGFFIILPVVVLIHELGHFLAARYFGIRVDAFSIGFGKPIVKWKDKKGTEWRIAWIPLGGYVSLYGQDMMFEREKFKELPKDEKKGHYLSVSAWKQAIVIAAGVIFNFILAFLIYLFIFTVNPIKQVHSYVGNVMDGSVALEQGIQKGDKIISINGHNIEFFDDIKNVKIKNPQKEYNLEILRNNKTISKTVSGDVWGIEIDETKSTTLKKTPLLVIKEASKKFYSECSTIYYVIKQIVSGDRSSKQLGSFLSIAQISGSALLAGFMAVLSLIAMISINLGIINLLPIPALDGGYLFILLIEGIIRKKLSGKYMKFLFTIGWIFIIGLFILTMKNDIVRVILK